MLHQISGPALSSRIKSVVIFPALVSAFVIGAAAAPAVSDSRTPTTLKIDGSSTVYPITEAVAEEFGKANSNVQITVGVSGTGGGFKKFLAKETVISNASRPIKTAEVDGAKAAGIEFIELPIAFDALTVVVNKKNTWAKSITTAELKKIWEPEAQGKILSWNQINPAYPDKPLKLFGPGVDSGTFDYFTEAINGKEDVSRGDFTASEDDNVLVQGVANDEGALGFFGLAYFMENKEKLKALPVDDGKAENGNGPQEATLENVKSGVYQPLARPLFIYVRKDAAESPDVQAFVSFYLTNAKSLTQEVGYIPLSDSVYKLALDRFNARTTNSIFHGGSQVGVSLEAMLAAKK